MASRADHALPAPQGGEVRPEARPHHLLQRRRRNRDGHHGRRSRTSIAQLIDAEYALNSDGGGGTLDDETGKPLFFGLQTAEKTYADFTLTDAQSGRTQLARRAPTTPSTIWPRRS